MHVSEGESVITPEEYVAEEGFHRGNRKWLTA
jgi:hypothetical protein